MPALLVLFAMIAGETWGIVQATHKFGGGVTMGLLLADVLLGVWLIKHGGLSAIKRMQSALARNELPAGEMFAGLITAFAGVLFILPGFISDMLAISLLLGGGSLRKSLGDRISSQMGAARPDLKKPVIIEGEYREKSGQKLR